MDSCYHKIRWKWCGSQPRRSSVSTLLLISVMIGCCIVTLTIPVLQDRQIAHKSQKVSLSDVHNIGLQLTSTHHRYLKNEPDKTQSNRLAKTFLPFTTWTAVKSLFKKKCPAQTELTPLPGRKGVALTLREEGEPGSWVENLPKVTKLRPYWNYSWGPKRIAQQPKDIEFVPMIWGGNDADRVKEVVTNDILPEIKNGNVKRVLGFNEPDSDVQSNMEVSTALDRWKELESSGVPLTSPSCANPGSEWMTSFMTSVDKNCKRIDWVGVHWYGTDFNSFKSAMIKYHDLYDRPILVTEFALADWTAKKVADNKISKAATLKFMKEALYWLETQSWITGYAWFSFDASDPVGTNSALFTENGTLTTLGKFYASVRTNRPRGDRTIT